MIDEEEIFKVLGIAPTLGIKRSDLIELVGLKKVIELNQDGTVFAGARRSEKKVDDREPVAVVKMEV